MSATTFAQGKDAYGQVRNSPVWRAAPSTPCWWQGAPDRWRDIVALHSRLTALEATPMRVCRLGIGGAVLGGAGAINAGVVHAVATGGPAGIDYGAVTFGCLGIFLLSVWAYEMALTLRGRNADYCGELWKLLVAAVQDGCVDIRALESAAAQETKSERSLREELQTAHRYLAAGGALRPRLNSYSRRMFGLGPRIRGR